MIGRAFPAGPMQPFVSERFQYPWTKLAAWNVLPLIGAVFEVDSANDIPRALRVLLASALPGLDWWVPEVWGTPFNKYGILHGRLPAPPDETTGEAMAIEIYGMAERAVETGSEEWSIRRREALRIDPRLGAQPYGVRLPTAVMIRVATYSNVGGLGFGVPMYM